MCGENALAPLPAGLPFGSPPRVRGKLVSLGFFRARDRITPACAGKTGFLVVAVHGSKDHPRVCGENRATASPTISGYGSPPRVRGKPTPRSSRLSSARITPACAGKTIRALKNFQFLQDHPRVCGENSR